MFGAPKEVKSKPVTLAKGGKLTIHIVIKFANEDIHLNEEAPNRYQVKAPLTVTANPSKANISEPKVDLVCQGSGSGEIRVAANLYYCDVSGACSMGNVDFVVPFAEGGSGDTEVSVSHLIEKFTD
jgi:hypothetical protein